MPGPETASHHSPAAPATSPSVPTASPSAPAPDTVSDVVRWAAFSCVLVPVVLVWYGTSLAGATGTALGLAAVTGVCRVLLRQSERGAARLRAEEHIPPRPRHGRPGPLHREVGTRDVADSHITNGSQGSSGSGARRGGCHGGGKKPVD